VPTLIALIGLLGAGGAHAAEFDLEIEGVDDELRAAVLDRLTLADYTDRDVAPATIRFRFDAAEAEIREALEPFGYYDVDVDADLSTDDAGTVHATLSIDRGEPVRVRTLSVVVPGPAGQVPEVAQVVAKFDPAVGERLDHGEYEKSRDAIGTALRSVGYLDAELVRHRVEVRIDDASANVSVEWDAGERYRFGAVRFPDVQFPAEFLAGYVPWKTGAEYSSQQVLELQQRLSATGYFETVAVQPDLDARANGEVPVDILLTQNERNAYTAGVYYSTDFGAGVRLGYERRWLNDRGHTLETSLEYSQRLEEYGVTYRIPRPGPEQREFSFGASYTDEESDSVRSRSLRVAAAESRQRWKGFARTLSLQYLRGDYEVGGERGQSTVLFAEGVLSRRRVDRIMQPRNGYSIEIGLRAAPEGLISDTSLLQTWVDGGYLFGIGKNDRLIARAGLGAMAVDDFDQLPPDLRFFAGGDRSVRGFDYQAIGEVNESGGVVGGQYLVTSSLEYEHYFEPKWGAAAFVDAGDAFTNDFNANVAVGIGARWRSPVGTVRLDFAKPVVTDFDDGWRIHLTIGPEP
jgi:translocation and assembly module TamA